MEFTHHPERMTDEEWNEAVRGSGAGAGKLVRVYFPNPKAALLVDPGAGLWLPWGRRREQPGDWPEGGWAREESLGKPYWRRWNPEVVVVRPLRWMEKDHTRTSRWFDLDPGQGILCLCLMAAVGTPLYVVTRPAGGDYLAEVHDRIPVLGGR
ncbi:MAG TPA: hypothetical protein VN436_03850 [Holophaga sp.]|nr:hypothetical protein [Holophaga sp.]